jgi:hypothetical protein
MRKKERKQPINCWGCEGDQIYKYCPHRGDKMRIVHRINQEEAIEDMGRSMPTIYATLDNIQADYQSHMIDVDGKIDNQPIAILIDYGHSHSYIDPILDIKDFVGRNIWIIWRNHIIVYWRSTFRVHIKTHHQEI